MQNRQDMDFTKKIHSQEFLWIIQYRLKPRFGSWRCVHGVRYWFIWCIRGNRGHLVGDKTFPWYARWINSLRQSLWKNQIRSENVSKCVPLRCKIGQIPAHSELCKGILPVLRRVGARFEAFAVGFNFFTSSHMKGVNITVLCWGVGSICNFCVLGHVMLFHTAQLTKLPTCKQFLRIIVLCF